MCITNDSNQIIVWKANVLNREIEVALDSGASTSIISLATCKLLNIKLLPSTFKIQTANGENTLAIGETGPIEIDFEGMTATLSFHNVELSLNNILVKHSIPTG